MEEIMGPLIYTDTTLPGYSARVDDDIRVLRQIEHRAQDLQREMWKLEARWQKRRESLEKRTSGRVVYGFHDMLV